MNPPSDLKQLNLFVLLKPKSIIWEIPARKKRQKEKGEETGINNKKKKSEKSQKFRWDYLLEDFL